MNRILLFCCLVSASGVVAQHRNSSSAFSGATLSFDGQWLFKKDSTITAESIQYNDATWRKLDLPHDWSIEDLSHQIPDSMVGPFSKAAVSGRDGGFLVGGTAWYRKHFTLNPSSAGKKVYILFDGVYMDADVWLNGHHLGNHPYGYTSFFYDLTPFLQPQGKSNVIAVRVRNEGLNSRWYSGSGIYRHVWLNIVNPLHIATWGTFITTSLVTAHEAEVSIETRINNSSPKSSCSLLTRIYSPSGKLVGKNLQTLHISRDSSTLIKQKITIANPHNWNLTNPVLYKALVTIIQDGKTEDETSTSFGIRVIHFDAKSGFSLNGEIIKLQGGCIHHDNGPLGAAAIDRAEVRKIELLKKQGYNAVRMSHNPPSPTILDACDRLGILVIDEAFDMWQEKKNAQDYHLYFNEWWRRDLQSMVLRDRNHPSIIMWSIGNEIPESADSSGYLLGKQLSAEVHLLDSTRPVTQAIPLFVTLGKKGKTWDDTAPSYANLDIAGYNYAYLKYESDHDKYPNRIMYASEYFPTKGIDNWLKVEKLPYVIGTFSWSAMDYLGEAGLGVPRLTKEETNKKTGGDLLGATGSELFLSPSWPIFNAYTGELDLVGDKKVNSYYLDVVWKRSEIEALVHSPIPADYKESNFYYNFPDQLKSWSFPGEEGKPLQVFVYTRAQRVSLELNGRVIGQQDLKPNSITAQFDVNYQPGTLIARCYNGEKQSGADTLYTVGKPVAVRLQADRNLIKADRNDLSYVHVEIVDDKGTIVPYMDSLSVKFKIDGPGEIAGVGNGNPRDITSFQKPAKTVFHGRGLVIVRPKGKAGNIVLRASANGLQPARITIISR